MVDAYKTAERINARSGVQRRAALLIPVPGGYSPRHVLS